MVIYCFAENSNSLWFILDDASSKSGMLVN